MRKFRLRYGSNLRRWEGKWTPPFPVAQNVDPHTFKCPLPMSDAELAVLARVFFGVPLSLEKLWVWDDGHGQARIREPYDSFHGPGFPFSNGDIAGYDRLGNFMRTVFGPMKCSASLGYTDFKRYSHRQWRRLEAWQESRRRNESSSLRPAFVRLARNVGAGENIVLRVDRRGHGVLTSGREDGALGSLTAGGAS